MINGFYNSNTLNKTLKEAFIKDAISLAYLVKCESKYTDMGSRRQLDDRLSIQSSIDYLLNSKDSILDCIDRYIYNQGLLSKDICDYEICFHTSDGPNDGWLLLYIIVNEASFNQLINKYELKLINYD